MTKDSDPDTTPTDNTAPNNTESNDSQTPVPTTSDSSDEIDTTDDNSDLPARNNDDHSGKPAVDAPDAASIEPVEAALSPETVAEAIEAAAAARDTVYTEVADYIEGDTPVVKDVYTWEDFKSEYYYDADGNPPKTRDGEVREFTPSDHLGFDPEETEDRVSAAGGFASALKEHVDKNTVNVAHENEDEFFSTENGYSTLITRYDLEKAVPDHQKEFFEEQDRYWVNKPYACVVLFRSSKENELKYYVVEPYLNAEEEDIREFLREKLQDTIKYSDRAGNDEETLADRAEVIAEEAHNLIERYNLNEHDLKYNKQHGMSLAEDQRRKGTPDDHAVGISDEESGSFFGSLTGSNGDNDDATSGSSGILSRLASRGDPDAPGEPAGQDSRDLDADTIYRDSATLGYLPGMSRRPEPKVLSEEHETLSAFQIENLLYYLKRDFIGYERIDPVKHDINVEDISCDGYNQPVFVYHTSHEQIISNVKHGEDRLDDFVVKLAQRSGKGISKRNPQVDATLPDGSRAQLTLGQEVSDHGTNYTIRQFKDVPFTPVDLINWRTFGLEEMAFLWLAIENNKSLIFAGGTASGKTTSLNAVSLFIPSNAKIVSIEDTREVELPQRNWIASVTRPSFSDDDKGDIDEFDLLEAALRQRPDYIVMGEVRGEEGRTLFQVMSTGHTTYTTFHADSVGEVLKRFTTDPINVSKTLFTALDLVSIQTQTRVDGNKVRRNKNLTEVNGYNPESDEINVQDVYQWDASSDTFGRTGNSSTLQEIMQDRGWGPDDLEEELFKREVILAYLIDRDLNTYTSVAATVQGFINSEDTILKLLADDKLAESLQDLREMESVSIDVDEEKEEHVPRPDPTEEVQAQADDILSQAESQLFPNFRFESDEEVGSEELADALKSTNGSGSSEVMPPGDGEHSRLSETENEAERGLPEGDTGDNQTQDTADKVVSADDRGSGERSGTDRFGSDDDGSSPLSVPDRLGGSGGESAPGADTEEETTGDDASSEDDEESGISAPSRASDIGSEGTDNDGGEPQPDATPATEGAPGDAGGAGGPATGFGLDDGSERQLTISSSSAPNDDGNRPDATGDGVSSAASGREQGREHGVGSGTPDTESAHSSAGSDPDHENDQSAPREGGDSESRDQSSSGDGVDERTEFTFRETPDHIGDPLSGGNQQALRDRLSGGALRDPDQSPDPSGSEGNDDSSSSDANSENTDRDERGE